MKKRVEEHLYNLIFDDGFQMLSSEFNSIDFHAMTHEDTEILGMFCDFSGIHGEKLKEVLVRGYVENAYRDKEKNDIEVLYGGADEKLQDAMIRAARKAHFSRIKAKEVFQKEGILKIYNLGMEHMYEFLQSKIETEENK